MYLCANRFPTTWEKKNLCLPSAVFIAQVLVGPSKQLKQIIQTKHNIVMNPNWPEANQLAIYKMTRACAHTQRTHTANSELDSQVSLFVFLLRHLHIRIQNSTRDLHFHRSTLQLSWMHATPNRLRAFRVIAESVRSSAPTDLPRTRNRAPSGWRLPSSASRRRTAPSLYPPSF